MSENDAKKRRLERGDILPPEEYAAARGEQRRRIGELKRRRRVEVGPFATFSFESFATMWHQVHEMLHIERGGEAQIQGEIEAYNPLIPQGSELIATVMFEIDEARRRDVELRRLGGIENGALIEVGGERIRGEADPTRENTDAQGKASSVQFLRFPFSAAQIARFKMPGAAILVGFDHPNYGHLARMPEPVRAALAEDFD